MSDVLTAPVEETKLYCVANPETFEIADSLTKKLTWLSKALVSNPVLTVLENVLFLDGVIYASDLKVTAMHFTSIKGKFLINGKKLLAILKNLNKTDHVSFDADAGAQKVSILVNKEVTFSFNVDDVNDYPVLPVRETNIIVGEMPSGLDIDSITQALKYTSSDELRPALTGVYLNQSHVVGTQGHLLYFNKVQDTLIHEEGFHVIIPKRAVGLIKDFDHATIKRDDTGLNILIKQKNRAVLFRKIDEKYPDYMAVVPTNQHIIVSVPKKEFLAAMNLGMLVANPHTNQARVAFNNGADYIRVTTEDLDFSHEFFRRVPAKITWGPKEVTEWEVDTDAKNEDGTQRMNVYGQPIEKQVTKTVNPEPKELFEIGFNLKFMISLIKDVESTTIDLKIQAPNKAILIGDNMLVMPVMLNQYR